MNTLGQATRFQSGAEAAQKGRKGGLVSVERRRARRAFREVLADLLSSPLPRGPLRDEAAARLAEIGMKARAPTMQGVVALALVKRAAGGDVRAFEALRDTLGERPAPDVRDENSKPFLPFALPIMDPEALRAEIERRRAEGTC